MSIIQKVQYKPVTLLSFQRQLQNEEDCWKWLFKTRFPDGYECPNCGNPDFFFKKNRKKLQCKKCNCEITLTAGTIFHKTRTPLLKWFWLIYRMAVSKTGVSIAEMQRELEICDYKTIWVMAHKIRKAMKDRDEQYGLDGLIEIDESFFGKSGEIKRGRGSTSKKLVIIAVSTWINKENEEQPGFARAIVVEDASAETIRKELFKMGTSTIDQEFFINKIRTDGWQSYISVAKELKLDHHRLVLKNPKNAMKYLPWTHKFIANAKMVLSGSHHGVEPQHLQSYLSEICFRFNRRWWQPELFHRLLKACVSTGTVTRRDLGINN
jgi:hypothetical protein